MYRVSQWKYGIGSTVAAGYCHDFFWNTLYLVHICIIFNNGSAILELVDIFEIFPDQSHIRAFIYRSCCAKGFCSKINILEGKFQAQNPISQKWARFWNSWRNMTLPKIKKSNFSNFLESWLVYEKSHFLIFWVIFQMHYKNKRKKRNPFAHTFVYRGTGKCVLRWKATNPERIQGGKFTLYNSLTNETHLIDFLKVTFANLNAKVLK